MLTLILFSTNKESILSNFSKVPFPLNKSCIAALCPSTEIVN